MKKTILLLLYLISSVLFPQPLENITETVKDTVNKVNDVQQSSPTEKLLLRKDKTSTVHIITADELEQMPIRNTNEILAIVPGVILQDDKLYIRGGRDNEVAYYTNGIPTTSFNDRSNMIYLPPEATEEIKVMVGGFDASIGGANSGVITRRIKQGANKFEGYLSLQADGPGLGENYLNSRSYGHRLLTGTFSGPIIKDKINFFTSVEKNYQDDPIRWGGQAFEFLNVKAQDYWAEEGRDTFNLVWPGYHQSNDHFTNYVGNITLDFYPFMNNLSVVYNKEKSYLNNSGWRRSGSILGVLRDQGATIYPAVEDPADAYSVTIPGRQGFRLNNSLLISNKFTFTVSPKAYFNLNLGYLRTNSEDQDEWFGNDWKKWYDGDAIQKYLGFDETVWSPNNSRYNQSHDYQLAGFSFAKPGTAPDPSYQKSKSTQFSISGELAYNLQNHNLSLGFDWRKSTIRQISISPIIMLFSLSASEGYDQYGITTYGSWEAIPDDVKRIYMDGYGYDYDIKEINSRKTYSYSDYSSPDSHYNDEAFYIDGPKKPSELGLFLQDKFEFDDIIINAGIRLDVFDADEETLANPDSIGTYENSDYIHLDEWQKVEPSVYLQPRLGLSLPISDRTLFHSSFGKFAQLPDLNSTWHTAYDYRTQIGRFGNYYGTNSIGYGIEPITTTQYEMGLAQQTGRNSSIEVTGFYKIQNNLITTERIGSFEWGEFGYHRQVNGDKSTTKGLEFKYTLRRTNRMAGQANYTYSMATGTGSDAFSHIATIDRGEEKTTSLWPLNHNQTHTGSMLIDYRFAENDGGFIFENLGINILTSFSSGHNYTPINTNLGGAVGVYEIGVDYMVDRRSNHTTGPIGSAHTPWIFNTDLRIDKKIPFRYGAAMIFIRITNLFNRDNIWNIYELTGASNSDGFLDNEDESDAYINVFASDMDGNGINDFVEIYTAINNENNEAYRTEVGKRLYSPPRQIFLGLSLEF